MPKTRIILSVILLTFAIGISQSVFIVKEGKQALVLQFGKPVHEVREAGLNFKLPIIQNIEYYERRILDVDPPPEEVTLSGNKRLVVDTFARYKIIDMLEYRKKLTTEQKTATRLYNEINDSLRGTLGNYTLLDILSNKRADIMNQIKDNVNTTFKDYGIEIVDVRIGRADLPVQTSQSIYNRMRSERKQEAAEFRAQGNELAKQITSKADRDRTVLLSEASKEAQILRGNGDEEAIKIYADAFGKDPKFYEFYRSMEAYKESMANDETTLVLTPDSEFFKFFGQAKGRQ